MRISYGTIASNASNPPLNSGSGDWTAELIENDHIKVTFDIPHSTTPTVLLTPWQESVVVLSVHEVGELEFEVKRWNAETQQFARAPFSFIAISN